jgi:DNA polymerase III alpha subunit
MTWSDFINNLKLAKKAKKNKGLSVSTIANLLFSGAMDSMITETPTLELYKKMYTEVQDALKSKAQLAKRKKTEMLGLAEVTDEFSLSLWRNQMNPLAVYDLISPCAENLKMFGFESTKHPAYPLMVKKSDKVRTPVVLTQFWKQVFDSPAAMASFETGQYELAILGIVTDVNVVKFSDGKKERMVFKLFTGVESTDSITVWPEMNGKVSEVLKASIVPMQLGYCVVRPKPFNGNPSATLLRWNRVSRS